MSGVKLFINYENIEEIFAVIHYNIEDVFVDDWII